MKGNEKQIYRIEFYLGPPKKVCSRPPSPPISEVSEISSLVSVSSLSSVTGDFPNSRMNGSNNLMLEVPEVHGLSRNPGLDAQVQMRKLSKKLEFLQEENDQYAKLVKEIPDAKQELFQLKNVHFELQRENIGLRSQLDSALNAMEQVPSTKLILIYWLIFLSDLEKKPYRPENNAALYESRSLYTKSV